MNNKYYIECGLLPKNNSLEFYLVNRNKRIYLFSKKYSKSVEEYFKNRMTLSNALDYSKARRNKDIENTMKRLSNAVRYIEVFYSTEPAEVAEYGEYPLRQKSA